MYTLLSALALAAAPQAVDPVGSIQKLDVPADPVGTVVIAVDIEGRKAEMVLDAHSLRASDFKLWVTRPDGSLLQVPAPAPNTYRGTIPGWPSASVTASINDEGLTAIVHDEQADEEWQIQPALGYAAGFYSVANKADLVVPSGICGVPNNAGPAPEEAFTGSNASRGTGLQLCELALDADFEFYQRNGNSVSSTLDDMERVLNRVDTIYVRDVDVTFQITGVVIRTTSSDPYTSNDAGPRLDQFRQHWNSNFGGVRRDLAHLFTGVNINGGTIGVAYLGAVCASFGYGLSESRFTSNISSRTGLTAHEIGHNFSANHCDGNGDCRIMCAGLGGCNNDLSRFGTSTANGIRNYAIARPCLLDLAPPLAVPFRDQIDSSSINTDNWISNQGVVASTSALNEPSPSFSLQVSALNNGLERDDVIISNKLLLDGQSGYEVFVAVQNRGVLSGNSLRVDIFNQNGDWAEIIRVTSNGTSDNDFTVYSADVPSNAYHDEAQIRIVAEVDGNGENWYVDDIAVTDQGCGATTTYCVGFPNSTGSSATLSNLGTTSLSANDFLAFGGSYPASQFGILIYGQGQTFNFLGNGVLCVDTSPTLYRLSIFQSDIFGSFNVAVDYNNLAPGSSFSAGETWNWQTWYRDNVGQGFNFSDAISVTFCP